MATTLALTLCACLLGAQAAAPLAPISLLRPDDAGSSMLVSEEGIAFLESLGDVPLAIVAVSGPARTGKTFFINQLAAFDTNTSVQHTGFAVGHSVTGMTKGMWLHSHVIDGATVEGGVEKPFKVLFVDTEGFGAPGNLEAFDPKLCFLTTVFASTFFYNVLGTINMVRAGLLKIRGRARGLTTFLEHYYDEHELFIWNIEQTVAFPCCDAAVFMFPRGRPGIAACACCADVAASQSLSLRGLLISVVAIPVRFVGQRALPAHGSVVE